MASQGTAAMGNQKAPYVPRVWSLGGAPVKHIDIPVQLVFLAFYIGGAVMHMVIFQKNRRRAHKFLPNLFIFIFCMSRVATSVLRIASVSLPQDIQLGIAAQIFVAAGVLILFVLNLIFAQRVVRATHPRVGWHPAFSIAYKVLYVLVGLTLAAVITATVQTFYTLNTHTRSIDRGLQLYGATFLAIVATLPIPITLLACLVPHGPHDHFGMGRFRTKVIGLLISSTLLAFGAWYRCGTSWHTPVPRTQPIPAFLGKGPFYVANFFVEIVTVYLYGILRIDLRWHIPNGAKGPGSYSKSQPIDDADSRPNSATEDEVVDDKKPVPQRGEGVNTTSNKEVDVEKGEKA